MRRGGLRRGGLRAGTYAKTPLDYEQNNTQSTLLFLETALVKKNPQTFLLFTTVRPSATHAHADAAAMALDGRAGQLGPTLAPLTGRPSSTTLAPTLA